MSNQPLKMIRARALCAMLGISRQTLYEWRTAGTFPQPVTLSKRVVAWRESDVADWIKARESRE